MGNGKPTLTDRNLDENMKINTVQVDHLHWYDPTNAPFHVSGFAWFPQEKLYSRLPSRPRLEIADSVKRLATFTSGGQIRFQTDTTMLAIKVKLKGKSYMSHMAATGQCGFDCYIGPPTKQLFYSVTNYDLSQQEYEVTLFNRKDNDLIQVTLNFPLYQGVEHILIGVKKEASVKAPVPYESEKKVIFYGTSITQGGCASRPGIAYTNILSRRINLEFLNLGFSGNGKGEPNMAQIITDIQNPACLVLDYEPNCVNTKTYKETLPTFISIYRESHPTVPILVVSKFPYASEAFDNHLKEERLIRLHFQRNLINLLKQNGDNNIYFFEGTTLLGEHMNEATVDGTHPNDLGFMSIANQLYPTLRAILD